MLYGICRGGLTASSLLPEAYKGSGRWGEDGVEAVAGLPCWVVGTRKATPGLRLLEKCAVRVGGGDLISMHALTHSAPTLDLSLELQLAGKR